MAQGTTNRAAWNIAHGGYGVIASDDDPGWYGKGIYLTSSLDYAWKYAHRKTKASKHHDSTLNATILVSAVIPGNILPVLDAKSQFGKPVANGYQSHYTIGTACFSFFVLLSFGVGSDNFDCVCCCS